MIQLFCFKILNKVKKQNSAEFCTPRVCHLQALMGLGYYEEAKMEHAACLGYKVLMLGWKKVIHSSVIFNPITNNVKTHLDL